MNNVKIKEDIDNLTYAMSDEELLDLSDAIFQSKLKDREIEQITSHEKDELIEYLNHMPMTQNGINTLSKLELYKKEDLEEENRILYATREWEEYI